MKNDKICSYNIGCIVYKRGDRKGIKDEGIID